MFELFCYATQVPQVSWASETKPNIIFLLSCLCEAMKSLTTQIILFNIKDNALIFQELYLLWFIMQYDLWKFIRICRENVHVFSLYPHNGKAFAWMDYRIWTEKQNDGILNLSMDICFSEEFSFSYFNFF